MANHSSIRRLLAFTIAAALSGAVVHTSVGLRTRIDARRDLRSSTGPESARAAYFRLPLRFEPATHATGGDGFVARGSLYAVSVSAAGAALLVAESSGQSPRRLTMALAGGNPHAQANARRALPGVSNYLIGNDRSRWVTGVQGYGEIEYRGVYRGVDIIYYGNQQKLEFDFVVAPGASLDAIALAFDGTSGVNIDADGDLVILTAGESLVQHRPTIYQNDRGVRRMVRGGYVKRDDGTIGFRVARYDRRLPLIIDPVLSYATYLGGAGADRGNGLAIDAAGNVLVAGETYSTDFPVVNPVQPQTNGFADAFVVKLNPAGDAMIYSTFFGGPSYEVASNIAVDESGNAYVAGYTESWDFPGTSIGSFGQHDAFVVKLDPAGALAYATRIAGLREDFVSGIGVDLEGRAHIAGTTYSADFPVVNPWQGSLGGDPAFRTHDGGGVWVGVKGRLRVSAVDAFAFDRTQPGTVYAGSFAEGLFRTTDDGETWTRANLPAQQIFAIAVQDGAPPTVFAAGQGGVYRSRDRGESWTVDSTHPWATAVVVTQTSPAVVYAAAGFPTTVRKSVDGGDTWIDTGLIAPVQFLAASGSTAYAATRDTVYRSSVAGPWIAVNGSSHDDLLYGAIYSLAVDPANPQVAYVGTDNGLFKTTSGGAAWTELFAFGFWTAVAIAPSDPSTVFITTPTTGGISYDGGETWSALQVDNEAQIIAAAFDPADSAHMYAGAYLDADAFLATLSADGSRLEYSTFIGGSRRDGAAAITVDANGNSYVSGETLSNDLPTVRPIQSALGGTSDSFVVKMSSSGEPAYATYLGGWGYETGLGVAADGAGRAYVTGVTFSTNFPVVNAWQPSHGGGYSDIFVTALNESGSEFVYSTYLGGSGMEDGAEIAVTPAGEVSLAGTTESANFPITPDAWHRTHAGGVTDVFVSRFSAAGALQYSTYLGGAGADQARRIAIDATGTMVVTGYTNSTDWARGTTVQPVYGGSDDAFVVKISPEPTPPDTIAPTSTIGVSGTEGVPGWYKSPVTVSLSAVDNDQGRGLAYIEYLVTGSVFKRYTGPFVVTTSGATRITVRATDWAGNVESPAPFTTVMIDTQAPIIGYQVIGTFGLAGWFKSPVTVTLFPVDLPPGTGVTSTEYRVGDGAFQSYTAPFAVSAEGITQITARATDANGNVGTSTRTIMIDTSPPRTSIAVSGTLGFAGWYKSPATVTLSGADNDPGSGVGSIEYRLNDGAFQRYSIPFTLSTQGVTRITARATDRAGNLDGAPPTTTVMIDTSAPKSTQAVTGTLGLGGWYTSPVAISVAASDNDHGSGVASIEFSINGGAFQSYIAPITLSTQGTTRVTTRATDAAGNVESALPSSLIPIDSSAPLVTIASPEARDYQHSDIVVVSFSATDSVSGVQSVSAGLDGRAVQNSQPISLQTLALGEHTVTASASDVAGNSVLQSVSFRIVATIDSIIASVNVYGEQGKIDDSQQRSLLAKLNDAKAALDRGNVAAAAAKLRDFIDQCTAQSGRGISADAAAALIGDAEYVLGTFQ